MTGSTDLLMYCRTVVLRTKWDAVKALPKMWRKRQAIQAGRVAGISEIWQVLDKRLFREW